MDHTAVRIMKQLEQEGDLTAEGIEAVKMLVDYSGTIRYLPDSEHSESAS